MTFDCRRLRIACATTGACDPIPGVSDLGDTLPDDIDALKAALLAERAARRELEARAANADAMIAHLKLMIARQNRDRFGASAERGRKVLDQLEMQLEELATEAAEDEAAATTASDRTTLRPFPRARPTRTPRRRICRASGSCCRTRRPAHAAAASSPSWARPSPRRWR
jgi:hypothetical protein